MAARKRSGTSAKLQEAKVSARTTRTLARWDGLKAIAPWVCGAGGAVGTAFALAGEITIVDFNVVMSVALSVTVPPGLLKIERDRRQKRRMRERMTGLEKDLRDKEAELREVISQRDRLEGQLEERRRGGTT